MFHGFLLIVALCLDSFMAAFAYGTNKVKIPLISAMLIAFIGSSFLGISTYAAVYVQDFLTPQICTMIAFTIFFLIGLSSLFQSSIKAYLKKYSNSRKLSLRYGSIAFVIDVYVDEMNADKDHSNYLSLKEAFYLAMALSLDSLVSGFALGIGINNPFLLVLCSFLIGLLAIMSGHFLGSKFQSGEKDISWLSGLIFIILAFMRLH